VMILSELHDGQQILFRGVSPELLMIDQKGDVIALDFRCAFGP
jgi:hypothetical protein